MREREQDRELQHKIILIVSFATSAALRVDVSVSRSSTCPRTRGGRIRRISVATRRRIARIRSGGPPRRKWPPAPLVAPLLLEETLLREADREFEYAVTGSGLMGSDLVAGSHRGVVKFADDDRGCALTWAVTFEAADNWRAALWQRVTENVIDTAAGNLAAYVATPLLHEIELRCRIARRRRRRGTPSSILCGSAAAAARPAAAGARRRAREAAAPSRPSRARRRSTTRR